MEQSPEPINSILPANEVTQLFLRHETRDEERFGDVNSKLDKILNNHLYHMEPDIASIKSNNEWQNYILKWLMGGIGTIVAGLILALITKFI